MGGLSLVAGGRRKVPAMSEAPRPQTAEGCRSCGAAIATDARFCSHCGVAIWLGASLQVDESGLEQDRRVVTVLFADMVRSTELAERLDPEDMRGILESLFNVLATELRRFGATIDKYAGDAVMATFGAPVAHEDDVARALACAIAMQDAVSKMYEPRGGVDQPRVGIRIGISTGPVVAGPLESQVQRAYTVVGDTVHVAQRLQALAQRGDIIVEALTHRLAYQRFAFESLGIVRVKGRSASLLAYRLVGLRTQTGGGASSPTPLGTELVGRDVELAAVREAVATVANGSGRVVFVTGEAGVGKSRLVAEARRADAQRPMLLREGRAASSGRTTSYMPFVEVLRQDAGINDRDTETESWQKLESRVQQLFPEEAADLLPPLGTLAGYAGRVDMADRVRYVDANAMKPRVFAAARKYLLRLTAELPTALVFEDWHWADTSSSELLAHVIPLVESAPLLVAVTGRDEPDSPSARLLELVRRDHRERLVEVPLRPLGEDDSARLAANLFGARELAPDLRAFVVRKADGNPFFIEELVRTLIDVHVVERDEEERTWRATKELDQVVIPDSLRGLIRARIDRLEDDARQVLKVASVIGRSFPDRLLRALLPDQITIDRAVGDLYIAGFIRERRRVPELEHVFKHALVHDAAYESILLQQRRELHRLVATTIERVCADRLDDFFSVLAFQFTNAGDWAKAREYLIKAGDQAVRIAADAEALALYREAFAAHERAFGEGWEPAERGVLERKMGEALLRRGVHVEAREHLERSLTYLGRAFPRSRSAVRLAVLGHVLRQAGHRLTPILFRPRPTAHIEEVIRTSETMSWIDFFADPERFVLTALRALNYSEEAGYVFGIGYGSTGFGFVCSALPQHRAAGWYFRRALPIAERSGHPLAIGLAYTGLGYHAQHALGDKGAAVAFYEKATSAYRQSGDLWRWSPPASLWSQLLRYLGETDRAMRMAEEIVRAGEEGGDAVMRMTGLLRLGCALMQAGDLDRAEAALRATIELGERIPDYQHLVCAQGFLGATLLQRKRVSEAITLLEDAAALTAQHQVRTFYATQARISLAEAYLSAAEAGDAAAMSKARSAMNRSMTQGRTDIEARPPAFRVKGTLCWLDGRQQEARSAWGRSLAWARDTGGRYDEGLTLVEIGRRTRDRDAVDRAVTVFEQVGAREEMQHALDLM
jgi:class 3 adenylate cyclase/tetratricopeptide (TPR) repeat protein